MGWFLLRRFVDLVRVYSVLTISRTHSNTFLLIDMKKRKSFFIEYLQWLLLKFYNYFSVSFHHCVSTKKSKKHPFADVLQNRCSYKFRKIHRKTPVPVHVLFFCKFFKFLPVLQNTSGRLLLYFVEYVFLESFFCVFG